MHTKTFFLILLYVSFLMSPCLGSVPYDWTILEKSDTLDLLSKGHSVGAMIEQVAVDAKEKKISTKTRLQFVLATHIKDNPVQTEVVETREYNFLGTLTYARMNMISPTGTSVWELTQSDKELWQLTTTVGGMKNSKNLSRVNGSLRVPYAIKSALLNNQIHIGHEWVDTLFDLTSASEIIVKTTCVSTPGKESDHFVFESKDNVLGKCERIEIDKKGNTLLQEVQPFFTARKAGASLSEKPLSTEELTPRLNMAEAFKVSAERSTLSKEVLVLTIKDQGKLHPSILPCYTPIKKGVYHLHTLPQDCFSNKVSLDELSQASWLKPTVAIQSNHPEIKALAKRLTTGLSEPCEIIEKCTFHVFTRLKKRNVGTFSNAYETLKAGYGDCGEHAALLTALLRANNIASTIVYGLVFMPPLKGYYYHAWVVCKGKSVIFVDPSQGKYPASVGYVPLVLDDDGTNLIYLGALVGRLGITYVPKDGAQ